MVCDQGKIKRGERSLAKDFLFTCSENDALLVQAYFERLLGLG